MGNVQNNLGQVLSNRQPIGINDYVGTNMNQSQGRPINSYVAQNPANQKLSQPLYQSQQLPFYVQPN